MRLQEATIASNWALRRNLGEEDDTFLARAAIVWASDGNNDNRAGTDLEE